jgi:hypothetical protein
MIGAGHNHAASPELVVVIKRVLFSTWSYPWIDDLQTAVRSSQDSSNSRQIRRAATAIGSVVVSRTTKLEENELPPPSPYRTHIEYQLLVYNIGLGRKTSVVN